MAWVKHKFSRTGERVDATNKHRRPFPKIVSQVIREADIILEVLDARFIEETLNKDIELEAQATNKKIIYILNKSDLTDYTKLKQQAKALKLSPYVLFSCKKRIGSKDLRQRIKIEASKIQKERVYVSVIGYPNTGKSSLINILIGKASAKSAALSGTTKGIQKLKLTGNIMILDSPGVIPIDEASSHVEKNMTKQAKIGVRNYDRIKNPELIIHNLLQEVPQIEKHYNIQSHGDSEVFLEILGRKKHIIKKGNQVDTDRAAREVLKDWQQGKIR